MIDELVDSLLHEGYALYPYTPGAHKNATPTPFGIVYPAGYEHGFDRLQLQCLVRGDDPELDVEVRFLQASGERHQAVERRAGVGAIDLPPLDGEIALDVEPVEPGLHRVTLTIENRTPFAGGTRAEALEHSLISTHPLLRVRGGTFVSPLEAPSCDNVNTWPVLANDDDTAMLGAAIVLPDHPQLAPESLRQPLRRDRDRGGAPPARARALRRRARGDRRTATRRCARWSSARWPRRRRTSSGCTA